MVLYFGYTIKRFQYFTFLVNLSGRTGYNDKHQPKVRGKVKQKRLPLFSPGGGLSAQILP